MSKLFESDIENLAIELLEQQGYFYLAPEEQEAERENLSEVVLRGRLKAAIDKLNPHLPEDAKEQALREVLNLPSRLPGSAGSEENLIENNEAFQQMLTCGVGVEYQKDGVTVGDKVWLIDFENPLHNDLLVCNQFTVIENNVTSPARSARAGKRPDVVLLVNGLPLVVIELKNPTDENATVKKAFVQLQNYKKAISSLFFYNGVLVASDGLDAKAGSLTSGWTRFMTWKTVDLPAPRPNVFFVYVIACDDGSHYIGQTENLRKRWKEHITGQAAEWTRKHRPRFIVHYEKYKTKEDAVKREKDLKTGFGRKWLKREIESGRARQAGGIKEDKSTTPQIETLINGMLRPDVLLDLVRQFTVFEKNKREDLQTGLITLRTIKKIAAYHQYHAVNKAIESTIRAASCAPMMINESPAAYGLPTTALQPEGDRKAGVVWHTQGSGKSLSMVFYAGKLIVDTRLGNPTIVVITDRNDLDDQLFDTFAGSKQLLRQEPIQAASRAHLKKLLKTAGGGIVFTTIQKFSPDLPFGNAPAGVLSENYELLSARKNIIVIADEAHRSQYGFGAKTYVKNNEAFTKYGFAKYLRDALPNASFVGFTGTPIEKEDASTLAVFGNYIDVYDIEQAVEDGATVRIYYESRLAKVHLQMEEKEKLDAEVEEITENEEAACLRSHRQVNSYLSAFAQADADTYRQAAKEKAKAKWTQLEAIVGHKDRLKVVAEDILKSFAARREVFSGKGMIVTMSRRIAVLLYDEIIKLRPDWHNDDKKKGAIKVVMTSSSSDPASWQMHNTTKQVRKELGERFKDPNDPLELVIVRDMWLTGFDAPCLHTMYIDKPMRGHNLMQAIARVNRVYKDKPGGLIVDYIGITLDLKQALATYAESGGKGAPALDQSEAIAAMMEKYEIIVQMFLPARGVQAGNGFDYKRYFLANTKEKLTIILDAQEHILSLENGKNRFTKQVSLLAKTFALSVPSLKAMAIKEEVGFFQAIKARLTKFEPTGSLSACDAQAGGKSDAEIETAIKQIVDKAIVIDGVIDIFDAAGIKKPDISILSDDFLEEVRNMKRKNLAMELLKKILQDEIKIRTKKNFIQSKKLSDMLDAAIKKYQNNLLTAAQVIEEYIRIAKEIKALNERGENLGLSEDEIAFYDALASNASAKEVLGDNTLRELAEILVQKVKANTTIDWTIKENVKAKLRVIVKRILRKYGYPPDKRKLATANILKQAELFADEWSS